MGRLQGEAGRRDSAHTALVVGVIATTLGATALFGIVAHTWTPLLPLRGAGPATFDSVAARAPADGPKSIALIPKRKMPDWIPFAPRADEFVLAQAQPAEAKPTVALLGEVAPGSAVTAAPPASLADDEFVVEADGPAIRSEGVPVAVAMPAEMQRARVAEP